MLIFLCRFHSQNECASSSSNHVFRRSNSIDWLRIHHNNNIRNNNNNNNNTSPPPPSVKQSNTYSDLAKWGSTIFGRFSGGALNVVLCKISSESPSLFKGEHSVFHHQYTLKLDTFSPMFFQHI